MDFPLVHVKEPQTNNFQISKSNDNKQLFHITNKELQTERTPLRSGVDRFTLRGVKIGDCIDCHIHISMRPLVPLLLEVESADKLGPIESTTGIFTFKFAMTSSIKTNGVSLIVTPSSNTTLSPLSNVCFRVN